MEAQVPWTYPPGHFYSPVVDTLELARRRERVFDRSRHPNGIDFREQHQLELLSRLQPHYQRLPFTAVKTDDSRLRYQYDNPHYSYGDAIVLSCMLMELQPSRIIEIGSGHSSCAIMDVSDRFLRDTSLSFIDPHPDLLYGLMSSADRARYRVIPSPVQDVDLAVFDDLRAGDVLFIDSTHVTKCGSDVNHEFFTILPRLASGVYIHFHDMFWPFEYPEEWFFETNRSWNELYLMRAFLMHNTAYEIVFFNDFMANKHLSEVIAAMPLFANNSGGALWLRKK